MQTSPFTIDTDYLRTIFVRTGLPHQVTVSPRLRAGYGLPADLGRSEWVELAWMVNLIINQCLPTTEVAIPQGRAWMAQLSSVPTQWADSGEFKIAVLQSDPATLQVVLLEELYPVSKNILLVEDNPHLREITGLFLNQAGIPHEWASDGEEAWAKLHASSPLAVVTDVEMPGMSGLELCRRIKADQRRNRTPVLVMSGNPAHECRALAAGALEFMAKPLDMAALVERLRPFFK